MKKSKYISLVVIVILLSVGFLVFKSSGGKVAPLTNEEPTAEVDDTQINLGKVENGVYQNDAYGFSLVLPAGMTATNFNEGIGTMILVSNGTDTTDGTNKSNRTYRTDGTNTSDKSNPSNTTYQMQIFVSQFDEDIPLMIARIKKDIPDLKMEGPIEIKTGGVSTVAFYSMEAGEKNREIWFVRGGFLYQVLAKAVDDNTTGTVMDGWGWK